MKLPSSLARQAILESYRNQTFELHYYVHIVLPNGYLSRVLY